MYEIVDSFSLLSIVVMLPIEESENIIKSHPIIGPGIGVQMFYNGKCTIVRIEDFKNIDEVKQLLEKARRSKRITVR